MTRILLLTVTNLAALAVVGLVLFAIESVSGLRLGTSAVGSLLGVAALGGFGGALASLAFSKASAVRMLGVRILSAPVDEEERWLVETTHALAARCGVAAPAVGIYASDALNAFATGARRNAALVAVSTALVRRLSRSQIAAVLGHELSHVASGDMVTLTLLQGVLDTMVVFLARVFGSLLDRTLFRNDRAECGAGGIVATMGAQAALGLLAGLLMCGYSRRRELRADRGAAALCGRTAMIGALEALQQGSESDLPLRLQAFGIHAAPRPGWRRLTMSHPPLAVRIAALKSRAGADIHDNRPATARGQAFERGT